MAEQREVVESFKDLTGKTVRAGDDIAVAVAANRQGASLRVGKVLEITAALGLGEYKDFRVKVHVDTASGTYGRQYNKETGRWEDRPYDRTYAVDNGVVKL